MNGMPIAHARTRNRTGKRSFTVAVDVENSSDYNHYTTKYVMRDKSLTPGLGQNDNDRAYRTTNLDDAVKFFVDVKEKYPKYSIWLFTDGYSFAPMRQQAMRRNEAHAGLIADGEWSRGSDKTFIKLIDAEIARRGEKAVSDLKLQRQQSRAANAAFAQKQAAAAKQKADSKKWFNDWLRGVNESGDAGKTPGQQLLNAINALDNSEMSTSTVFMAHPSSSRRAIDFVVDSFDEGVLAIKWCGRGMQPLTVKDFLEQLREAGVKKISEIIWIIDADGDLEISEVGMPNSMRNICLFMKKVAD